VLRLLQLPVDRFAFDRIGATVLGLPQPIDFGPERIRPLGQDAAFAKATTAALVSSLSASGSRKAPSGDTSPIARAMRSRSRQSALGMRA